jgi:hypothetical protein
VNRAVRAAAVVAAGWLLATAAAPSAWAAPDGRLRLEARLDGHLVGDGRLAVDPSEPVDLTITVSNNGSSPSRVKTVRLSGTALGLTFFAYDTAVAIDVPPGRTVTRTFPLDLADLGRQATGLLPSSVRLIGPDRAVLGEVSAVSDVRGSMWSVYAVFGLAVVVVTVLAWVGALVALATHRLPANRGRRALRFLPAGFGTGLAAVITLSVTRLVAPAPAAEIPLVLGCAAAALLLGYLTPYPGEVPTPSTDADPDTVDLAPAASRDDVTFPRSSRDDATSSRGGIAVTARAEDATTVRVGRTGEAFGETTNVLTARLDGDW